MKKIVKICGLRREEDITAVNEARPDLAGFVLFFPKSRRNIGIDRARELLAILSPGIKSVAVTVSPDNAQIRAIESAGFDLIQIHGAVEKNALDGTAINIIKAFNVSDTGDFEEWNNNPRVKGFIFDAHEPGSGRTFDHTLLEGFRSFTGGERFFLVAGGLNASNAAEAVALTGFDGADTSSGVENPDGTKNRGMIIEFTDAVHNIKDR